MAHGSIAKAPPVAGELWLGWTAHYSIGIAFCALLVAIFGLGWARSPTLGPALLIGVVTVVAPLLILQPALGAGIASTKTAAPLAIASKSLATHGVRPGAVSRRAAGRGADPGSALEPSAEPRADLQTYDWTLDAARQKVIP